ncbi:MAG TPA: FMN-binding protein [Spirochaetia bacterium]|nr:FMN-binding protein [Spirochaetia bacterium]
MDRQGTIYTMIFSFIVTFAFVFLLSLTNQATVGMVKLNQETTRQSAILAAMGIAHTGAQDVLEKFRSIRTEQKGGVTLYTTTRNGETIYAAEFAGSGLWSTIRGVVGVNSDVTRILGLEIISQGETPGLGGRIDEQWFKDQFTDEKVVNGQIQVDMHNAGAPDTSHDNGQVDGITGATITSTSVGRIVNDELKTLRSILGGKS